MSKSATMALYPAEPGLFMASATLKVVAAV